MVYTNDCTPVGGQTIRFKLMDGETGTAKVEEDGTIHLPEDDENTFQLEYYWAEIPKPDYQMPSLWKSVFKNSLIGISIHCTTEKEAKDVLNRAHVLGWKWADGSPFTTLTYWDEYGSDICYDFYNCLCDSITHEINGGQIIYPAEWFIELADSVIDKRSSLLGAVVNCKTREEAVQFTYYANNLGYKWIDGSSYLDNTQWDSYKENTWYCPEMGTFGSRADFARTYPELSLLSFKDFKAICEGVPEVKKLTKEDLKDTVIHCTTREELELCYGYAVGIGILTLDAVPGPSVREMVYKLLKDQACIDFTDDKCTKPIFWH